MALQKMRVDPDVLARLGPDLVVELRENLWAIDCQTCGRGFGRWSTPVLGVRDFGDVASARVHHKRCLNQPWEYAKEPQLTGQPTLTWRTSVLVDENGVPFYMVNPSCEAATLLPSDERWRLANVEYYEKYGLATNPAEALATVTPSLTARLSPSGHLIAELEPIPGVERVARHAWQWTMPPAHPFTAMLHASEKVLIGITTVLRVGTGTTQSDLYGAILRKQIAFGSAELRRTDGSD
jgi:hypothetical protein